MNTDGRKQALAGANRIRTFRSELKTLILKGEWAADAVVENPPEWAKGMRVYDILKAQRYWGGVKTLKALGFAEVDQAATLGGLTDKQREDLIVLLRGRGDA